MGKTLNSLTFRHISGAVNNSLEYIDGRRKGLIKSLKTSSPKLNWALLDGVEWNKIFSIGAMSGSGKSVFCEQLKQNFVDLNPKEKFKILSFEFEMPSYEQITRNISSKLSMSTAELYSGQGQKVDDATFDKIKGVAKKINRYPIYTVDDVGSVEQILDTVRAFAHKMELVKKKEGLVVTIDHALLTQMKQGEDERRTIAHLYRSLVGLKKKLINAGIRCLFIILNQLNRNIETLDRKGNRDYHYPNRTDLFGSNDIFMGSDYVLIIHKPAILKLEWYGTPKGDNWPNGLPVYNPHDPEQAMIYFHLIKHRAGKPRIMMMLDEFHNSKIVEYKPK